MSEEVWVWAEQHQQRLVSVSLELIGKGQELAQKLGVELAAVLIGNKVGKLTQELAYYGANKVYLIENPQLHFYQSDVYADLMAGLIEQHKPNVLLFGATSLGRDMAATVAAKAKTGLTAHCIDLYINKESQLIQVVPGMEENTVIEYACRKNPQMATVKPGIFTKPERDDKRRGQEIRVTTKVKKEDFKAQTIEMVEEKPSGMSIEEADIVVAVGWGLYSLDSFKPVEELAELLGAAIGGTRPAVDKGWVSEDQMIGQSGKTVSPQLFISLGASGAMHFTTGFMGSKVILAVDQNPQAPIFQVADIGIVGDLSEVVPYLIEEFKKVKMGKRVLNPQY